MSPADRLLWIDTDVSLGTPGAEIDDGAALIVLFRALPAGSIAGISTIFGNVAVELATQNAARLRAYLGRSSTPIYTGAERPLEAPTDWLETWHRRYGETPAWPVDPAPVAAHQALIELIRRHPGEVTILALGPLTNLALALAAYPQIAQKVKAVIAMGGSFGGKEAEFNFRCDPQAALAVLHAGWPITLLGLEITRRALFTREDFSSLPGENPAISLLKKQALPWIDTVEEMGWEQGGCALHDAVAAMAYLDATLFEFRPAKVTVDPENGAVMAQSPAQERDVQVAGDLDEQSCYDEIMDYLRK